MNPIVMNLKVGELVLLVDGRGCHRVHVVSAYDKRMPMTFQLEGWCWAKAYFQWSGERDAFARPVLRLKDAAIGANNEPYHPLFLPHGWNSPAHLKQLLRASETKH